MPRRSHEKKYTNSNCFFKGKNIFYFPKNESKISYYYFLFPNSQNKNFWKIQKTNSGNYQSEPMFLFGEFSRGFRGQFRDFLPNFA